MKLVNNVSTAGTFSALEFVEAANKFTSSVQHWVFASGTFNGATAVIQISPDGLNTSEGGFDTNAPLNSASRWYNVTSSAGTFTAGGYAAMPERFRKARVVITGGPPSNLTIEVVG